jgi:hypothetical protein
MLTTISESSVAYALVQQCRTTDQTLVYTESYYAYTTPLYQSVRPMQDVGYR